MLESLITASTVAAVAASAAGAPTAEIEARPGGNDAAAAVTCEPCADVVVAMAPAMAARVTERVVC